VLVLAELPGDLGERLGRGLDVAVQSAPPLADAELAARVVGCDGLLTLLTHEVGERTFAAADRLRIVANCAVGVDNVDLAAAARRGVVVTHTPAVLTEDTADLTWALILMAVRRLGAAERLLRAGRFDGWRLDLALGEPLAGKLLGVVGAGRIGQAVLRRASVFGVATAYTSRRRLPPAAEQDLGTRWLPLDALFAEADIVSLHLPLTAETRHLVDQRRLAAMRRGAVLINTARGPIVDEAALVAALRSGQLSAAGLDVFEREPRVHPGLLELENAVLLPHVGSATTRTRYRMAESCVESLRSLLVEGRLPAQALGAGAPGAAAGERAQPAASARGRR
jgi:glyoxylate reductase